MTDTKKERIEEQQEEIRKPYEKPAIIHDIELETRAGSPLDPPNPLEIFD